MMVHTKTLAKEDMKMLYTEKEKNEIERVRKVFEKHIQQMTAYDLVWSVSKGRYRLWSSTRLLYRS